jgi:hypothetical protein
MFLVQGILKWGRNFDLGQGTLLKGKSLAQLASLLRSAAFDIGKLDNFAKNELF